MKKMLLKDIPRRCPECDALMHSSAPRPKISKKAYMVALTGIPLTALWLLLFFNFSPVYISPMGLSGIFLCFLVYGWPLYLMILLARSYPEVIISRCFKCKWTETVAIEMPKI